MDGHAPKIKRTPKTRNQTSVRKPVDGCREPVLLVSVARASKYGAATTR